MNGYLFTNSDMFNRIGGRYFKEGRAPTPPTPSAILIGSTLLTVMGGYRAMHGTGMSVIPQGGKPFFKTADNSYYGSFIVSEFDPHLNTGGNRHNGFTSDGGTGYQASLQYVGASMYQFYNGYFNLSSEIQARVAERIQAVGRVETYLTFKPHHAADTTQGELERNLCLPENFTPDGDTLNEPVRILFGNYPDMTTQAITKPTSKIRLNTTNIPNTPLTQGQTITYRQGYRVGEGLVFTGLGYGYAPSRIPFSFKTGYFSFPFDYENEGSAEYLQLDVEITMV